MADHQPFLPNFIDCLQDLPSGLTTRFAPSPTGYLHLGHVLNMIYVWGIAKTVGAKVILRIEDHDRQRCKPEHEQAILDDLEWLGFLPDEPSIETFRNDKTTFRQSDNQARYEAVLNELEACGLVYGCDLSRKQLEAHFREVHGDQPEGQLPYPNLSRNRKLGLTGDVNVRIRLPDQRVRFRDLRLGEIEHYPQTQCGDMKLRDRRSNWSYQFACVIDDIDQGVDFIIRGEDLLESTGRQLLLRTLLGKDEHPLLLHHSLLLNTKGRKLSKRQYDTSISEMREHGTSAEQLIGEAAWRGGLVKNFEKIKAENVGMFFQHCV